jgi:undecaprenyl pyrophosphate phosphatase UppP
VTYQARQALKVIIGVTPFIIFAAVIESYVTGKYQEIPGIVKMSIIMGTFVLMLFYLMSKSKSLTHEERRI